MKLSVIVPFYNVEKYIEKCAVSLLNQTYQDTELVLFQKYTYEDACRLLNW